MNFRKPFLIAVLAFFARLALAQTPTLPAINTNFVVNITNAAYGATTSSSDNSAAIQAAINAAAAGGTTNGLRGGTVEIPGSGTYMSGPLAMKSYINLKVDSGATLKFISESTYPDATGSPPYPIASTNLTDLEVSGPGTIDGNGAGWWSAKPPNRPYMIYFSKCQRVLIQNVKLQNPPKMHIVFKSATSDVTIQGITIITDPNSPNTDGMDLIGTRCLVQNCLISTGDDNIAIGTSSTSAPSDDILVTNCIFGFGHGVSIGSNTADGVNDFTVINCIFTNTSFGIRMKSDNATSGGNGEGGLAQNLNYYNLKMTNVAQPILIYSYYNEDVTPPAPTTSPSDAQAEGYQAIVPGAPGTCIWSNIVFSNLVVKTTGFNGSECLIWGRTEMPVFNVSLINCNIQTLNPDVYNFGLYNIDGLQIINSQISTPAGFNTFSLYNASNVVISNSSPTVDAVSFDGLDSTNSLALYNAQGTFGAGDLLDETPVTLSGATLAVNNTLTLPSSSVVNFALGATPAQVNVDGDLDDGGVINVTNAIGFGVGSYTLFTYTGNLDAAPTLNSTPAAFTSYTYTLTNMPGELVLVVANPAAAPSPPAFNLTSFDGANLVLSGSDGTANDDYYVLASTNPALPLAQWLSVATNQFDASGNFAFTNQVNPASPQLFFRLFVP